MTSPVSEIYPFGLLVKSWATGLDYFSTSVDQDLEKAPVTGVAADATWALPPMSSLFVPIAGSSSPATISAVAMTWDTFEGILQNADNVMTLGDITNPGNVTNVVIVQGDTTTLVLRLPPKLKLQQSEKALLAGAPYEIPPFYATYFAAAGWVAPGAGAKHRAPAGAEPAPADILKLQANRIGDYTMSNCN
jgi:hypothetical protein